MPDLETSLTYCTYCPNLCRHTCPVSSAEPRETLIPRAKMATLGRQRHRELEITVESAAPLYGCTGCGACTDFCHHKVEPAAALFEGRADATRKGHGHPALAALPARVRARAESAARKMRAAFAPGGGTSDPRSGARDSNRPGTPLSARFPSEAQVALLPACEAPAAARTTIDLLRRLGAGYVVVADVTLACGGYPLLAGGEADAFRSHAETLARQLHGYARIVVACPACAHTMKHDYPAHGVALRPEVLHLAEFLGSFAGKIAPEKKLPAAFYHDPCYLGRRDGVYDAPRALLSRALTEVREFSRNRNHSACSGGGGVLPLTMPETADAIASARVAEPAASDVKTIVTACPTCEKRLTRDGVTARGLVDVLDEATR